MLIVKDKRMDMSLFGDCIYLLYTSQGVIKTCKAVVTVVKTFSVAMYVYSQSLLSTL